MAVESSFPAIHVTGPVHFFARTPAHANYSTGNPAAKLWYLGTCETKPQIQVTHHRLPVFNDLGGRKAPFQSIKQRETAVVGLMLNRFSHHAFNAIATAGGQDLQVSGTGIGLGTESYLGPGSLTFGVSTVEIWARYTFFGTTNASAGLPLGRYFPCCELVEHQIAKSGTEEEAMLLVFQAQSLWTGTGTPASGALGFKCFSERYEDFPAEFNSITTLLANGVIQ